MANKKSRKRNRTTDVKAAAANDTTLANLPPRLEPETIIANDAAEAAKPAEAPVSARTAAIRRSQAGKFNKQNLTVIGGKEAPKFYPWTWAQRDKFMASGTPEAEAVKARYEEHLRTVGL